MFRDIAWWLGISISSGLGLAMIVQLVCCVVRAQ